jgi:sulfoxide reductase heme-binding subunit YedZ
MKAIGWSKLAVFPACLIPLAHLASAARQGNLGANPLEVITHTTGDWTIRFLLITLSITPLRQLSKQYWLIQHRRMLGLFAFFYGTLHLTTYLWFDKFFHGRAILDDVGQRKFITVGFLGFVLMIPLAITSTKEMIRRLGKRWTAIHRLLYVSATAGVIHYYWLVKADHRLPLTYGAILVALLAYRLAKWAAPKLAAARVATASRNA